MTQIEIIEKELVPLRKKLTEHRVYQSMQSMKDVQVFMEKHVYAVWDFMSLLKALQMQLTCTALPWKPVSNPKISRFINEIVLGEESDVNEKGEPKSHYEMYLDAMKEVGANTTHIEQFLNNFNSLDSFESVLAEADLKAAERAFLNFTFKTIATGESHKIASAFTFGREDLIPDMFIEIINQSVKAGGNNYEKLTYYLQRHIEMDGDEHGPLSLEMIQEVCGADEQKWKEVPKRH